MDLLFGGGSGGTTYIDSAARLNSVIRYRRTEDAVCQTLLSTCMDLKQQPLHSIIIRMYLHDLSIVVCAGSSTTCNT